MSDPAKELRATLHRAADLIADMLEQSASAPSARRRRTPAEVPVDDVSRKFAENTLVRLGWPIPQTKRSKP